MKCIVCSYGGFFLCTKTCYANYGSCSDQGSQQASYNGKRRVVISELI